jgi:hypothetical protein
VPAIEAQPRVIARRADGTGTGADPSGASDPREGYLTRSSDEEVMPQLKCVACKTRLRSRKADPIGDLCAVCGFLLEPVADLGEIVGYRVIETRASASPGVSRRSSRDASSRTHKPGLAIESCDADPVSAEVQALSARGLGAVEVAPTRSSRATCSVGEPRTAITPLRQAG